MGVCDLLDAWTLLLVELGFETKWRPYFGISIPCFLSQVSDYRQFNTELKGDRLKKDKMFEKGNSHFSPQSSI